MDYSKWAEMQQFPPNPNPPTDPYAQLYDAQPSSYAHHSFYPHPRPPQNPNPSLPAPHTYVGYEGQASVVYGHQPAQTGALVAAAYYQDSSVPPQNWAVIDAIRQFGTDPVGYAAVGTRPPNGMEPLISANPNPIFYTNPTVRPHGNGTWRRGPKKTKIVQSAWCELCRIDCNSKEVLDKHKLGKKHKKNLEKLEESKKGTNATVPTATPAALVIGPKENPSAQQTKRKAAPPSVPEEDLETKRRKLMEGGAAVDAVKVCVICNVVCNSETVFKYHLSGQKHAAMVKKQAVGTGTAV